MANTYKTTRLSRKHFNKNYLSLLSVSMLRRSKPLVLSLLLIAILVVIFHNQRTSNKKIDNFPISNSLNNINYNHDCQKPPKIDAFSKEIMEHMTDFGQLECHNAHEISMKFYLNNTFTVSGYYVDSINSKEILKEGNGFTLGDKYHLLHAKLNPNIKPGNKAGLRNLASSRCVVPEKYNEKNPPEEIFLIFSDACNDMNAIFTFTEKGIFKHELTGKCFEPKGGVAKNDVPLMLTNKCNDTFTVINEGVLQHSSKLCIHPLWGGNVPTEGQKLCFYDSCDKHKRLQYKNYMVLNERNEKKVIHTAEIKKEMNIIEISTADEKSFTTFVSSVQKKALKHLEGSATGHESEYPNIYLITLDEVSAAHFKRKLPKSNAYLHDKMKTLDYDYYASVTDSTPENVHVMLNGIHPADNSSPVSIFSLSRKSNYASLFVGDFPYEGFEKFDADHNGIPMYQVMKRYYDAVALKYCLLTQPMYEVMFNYFKSFINTYNEVSKLAVMVLSEMTQRNHNFVGYIDSSLESILRHLHKKKNTIVVINSIKGSLTGRLSKTSQGMQEYRRPLLQVYFSDDIKDLKLENSRKDQLSSPYDVYVSLSEWISKGKTLNKYGKSLTENISRRSCFTCGIMKSMCPCSYK